MRGALEKLKKPFHFQIFAGAEELCAKRFQGARESIQRSNFGRRTQPPWRGASLERFGGMPESESWWAVQDLNL